MLSLILINIKPHQKIMKIFSIGLAGQVSVCFHHHTFFILAYQPFHT